MMDKKNAALLSVFSNTVLIIFKLVAGIAMGSISVISEAIHSSIDLIASCIAFFSIRKASKDEDEEHPFGHGKYENVSGLIEALLILFAAGLIIYEAMNKLVTGNKVENIGAGILVMSIASIVNLIISLSLLSISKKTNSIALEADAMHLLTDVFTSAGVLLGLLLLKFTGIRIIDPITAVLVAVLIIKTSIDLINKAMIDLVDSKLPDDDILKIEEVLKSYTEVENYHSLKTRKSGNKREINVHVHFNKDISLFEAHSICDSIENHISSLLPGSDVIIHAEPNENAHV